MTVSQLLVLIPLFPLLACAIVFVLGPKYLKEWSHWPVVMGCALSCACSFALLATCAQQPKTYTARLYTWVSIPDVPSHFAEPVPAKPRQPKPLLEVPIQLRADTLTATMLAMVTFISTLVALYAGGYMHGERGYWRFFAAVALFVFSMINLVLAGNFLQLFVFWEAVGLCSYMLIGFWYEKPEAAAAGMKAFVVNRIGDFGFAAGIFFVWTTFGSVEFDTVLNAATVQAKDPNLLALICLCLFAGACGKSAQFPLHVWLPDAMEGPTPVSALIHAATMVTAGVYMVARCTPLYQEVPDVQAVVATVGCFTALLAALIALTQTDLKRVLAYSTVSQLGFMFLGLGTATAMGISGAMFHLVTHAFFKALLFLGAGSVMHAMGGVIDMTKFSGLRKVMPQTHLTFAIGALALAGLAPLSGFWSKDTILSATRAASLPAAAHHAEAKEGEHEAEHHAVGGPSKLAEERKAIPVFGLQQSTLYKILFWTATFTAFLTAFYTTRAYLMTFWGPEKIPHEAGHHAHESPPIMTVPLWILSIGAAFLGMALGHTTGIFDRFLGHTIPGVAVHHDTDWTVVMISIAISVAGIGLGVLMYGRPSSLPATVAKAFGPLTDASRNKFYLDEVFGSLFVLPLQALAHLSRFVDWLLIDTVFIGGLAKIPSALLGRPARPMQNGLVQFYALSMMLALAVLMWALLLKQ